MDFASAQRILICLRYGIGDLVMQTPALGALRRGYPHLHITAVGARPALELLEGDERLDAAVCVQDLGLLHWGDPGSPEIERKLRRWLDESRFDLVLDPSHAVLGLGRVIWESGRAILDSGAVEQDRALAEGADGISAIRRAVRSGWGVEVPETEVPSIFMTGEERRFAEIYLAFRSLRGKEPIALSPVASSPLKRWPLTRFAALADSLLETTGRPILLFAGPHPEVIPDLLAAMRHRDRVVPVGPLHLRRVAALLSRCSIFLGNDTGLMHLAAAVGTPVVAVFGPTSPNIYLPPQVPSAALGGRIFCSIRKTDNFGPPRCVIESTCFMSGDGCIGDASLEEVIAAAETVLAGSEGGSP